MADCDVLAANGINGICVKSKLRIGCLSFDDNFVVVVTGTKFVAKMAAGDEAKLLFEPNEAGVDSIRVNFGVCAVNVLSSDFDLIE